MVIRSFSGLRERFYGDGRGGELVRGEGVIGWFKRVCGVGGKGSFEFSSRRF